jgi:hypothetical protein
VGGSNKNGRLQKSKYKKENLANSKEITVQILKVKTSEQFHF